MDYQYILHCYYGLAVLCFYSKTGFVPHTAKSQPIWMKFCTHLLLYGIHLWAELDRDRRVGSCKPNQNDYVFVILVTHPKFYRRLIAAISAANPHSGGEDWCYCENFRNFVACAESDPKLAFFRVFRVLFDYPAHSLQRTSFDAELPNLTSNTYVEALEGLVFRGSSYPSEGESSALPNFWCFHILMPTHFVVELPNLTR